MGYIGYFIWIIILLREIRRLIVNFGYVINIILRLKFYVIVIFIKVVSNVISEFLIWGKSEKSNKFWCLELMYKVSVVGIWGCEWYRVWCIRLIEFRYGGDFTVWFYFMNRFIEWGFDLDGILLKEVFRFVLGL